LHWNFPLSFSWLGRLPWTATLIICILSSHSIQPAKGLHHMRHNTLHWVNQHGSARWFRVTNRCSDDIYPAIVTQAGTGPKFGGFLQVPGTSTNFTVSADWQGRIWARTNCSFNAAGIGPWNPGGADRIGKACLTGDCGGVLSCKGSVSIISQSVKRIPTNVSAPQGGNSN
jgi:hypothetical protein